MYKLEPLSYSYDALEPVICSEIMQLHYDKHLNGYVTNYNNAIKILNGIIWILKMY